MKRIRAIQSFHSNGYSMFFGKEVEVDDELAEDWKNAGLAEIVGEIKKTEEPKELTPEEIERQNLEAMAKQLGIVDGFNTLSNEELENNIHDKITKKRDEREAKLKENQGQEDPAPTDKNVDRVEENTQNSAENVNVEPNTENQEPVLKKGKKTQSTAE